MNNSLSSSDENYDHKESHSLTRPHYRGILLPAHTLDMYNIKFSMCENCESAKNVIAHVINNK